MAGGAVDILHRVEPVAVRLPLGEIEAPARLAADGASSLVDLRMDWHATHMNKKRTKCKSSRLG
jgi:hypothetical protein